MTRYATRSTSPVVGATTDETLPVAARLDLRGLGSVLVALRTADLAGVPSSDPVARQNVGRSGDCSHVPRVLASTVTAWAYTVGSVAGVIDIMTGGDSPDEEFVDDSMGFRYTPLPVELPISTRPVTGQPGPAFIRSADVYLGSDSGREGVHAATLPPERSHV